MLAQERCLCRGRSFRKLQQSPHRFENPSLREPVALGRTAVGAYHRRVVVVKNTKRLWSAGKPPMSISASTSEYHIANIAMEMSHRKRHIPPTQIGHEVSGKRTSTPNIPGCTGYFRLCRPLCVSDQRIDSRRQYQRERDLDSLFPSTTLSDRCRVESTEWLVWRKMRRG